MKQEALRIGNHEVVRSNRRASGAEQGFVLLGLEVKEVGPNGERGANYKSQNKKLKSQKNPKSQIKKTDPCTVECGKGRKRTQMNLQTQPLA